MSEARNDLFERPEPVAPDLPAIAATITDAQIDDAIQASLARAQQYKKWPDDFKKWEIEPYRTDMRNSIAAALARREMEARQ